MFCKNTPQISSQLKRFPAAIQKLHYENWSDERGAIEPLLPAQCAARASPAATHTARLIRSRRKLSIDRVSRTV